MPGLKSCDIDSQANTEVDDLVPCPPASAKDVERYSVGTNDPRAASQAMADRAKMKQAGQRK